MLRFSLVIGIALAVLVSSASAEEPTPIKLTLTPTKPPTPALRYQLLPDARLTTSGDAAPIYRQVLFAKKPFDGKKSELYYSWTESPLDQLPKGAMRKELAEYDGVYERLDQATRCDHCDWGVLERVRKQGIGATLPELQPMRECGLLLALRARLEIAEGRFDKVLVTLHSGLALARHTGDAETFVNFLVGADIAHLMNGQLDQFVGRPDAPNLYYALTDLPVPLVSQRKAIQGERVSMYGTFPGLAQTAMNLDAGNLSEKQLQAIVNEFDHLKRYGFEDERFYYPERMLLAQNIQKKHDVAKRALIAAGRPRDKVEAMPAVQVAMLHALLEYDATFDEMLTWQGLPYWEIADRLKYLSQQSRSDTPRLFFRQVDYLITSPPFYYYRSDTPRLFFRQETRQRLVREKDPNAPAIPLLPLLFPRMDRVVSARVRTDRKIALLRTIEAIRFYAATHDDKLPGSLAAVKEVPIPMDPMTGQAFVYQLVDDKASLRAPPPGKEPPTIDNNVVYELCIRK